MVERCPFSTFSVKRCPISTFWVERCPFSSLFCFTGHCLTLFDYTAHCSTLFGFVRLYRTLFVFVRIWSTLSGISRRVLNYKHTRISLDCFCQTTFRKSQAGQPQNLTENATKLSIVDSCSPSWVVGLTFQWNRPKMAMFRPVRLKMAMFWPTRKKG